MNNSEPTIFVLDAVPTAVIRDRDQFPETFDLLSSAVGNEFHRRGVNELGMIELWIDDDGTESSDACAHSVWIERAFLTPTETGAPNKPEQPSPTTR